MEHICENSDEIISAILSVDATLIQGKEEWKDINKKVIHFGVPKNTNYLGIIGYDESHHIDVLEWCNVDLINRLAERYSKELCRIENFVKMIFSYHELTSIEKSTIMNFYNNMAKISLPDSAIVHKIKSLQMKNPLTIHNLLLVDSTKIEGYNLNLSDLGTDTFGAKHIWRPCIFPGFTVVFL